MWSFYKLIHLTSVWNCFSKDSYITGTMGQVTAGNLRLGKQRFKGQSVYSEVRVNCANKINT